MSIVNIISAIGNNSSVYPLIVRDCGIEVPTKVFLTYKQNAKESKEMAKNATRERLIDEYGTSLVWLGGIPLMDKICNWGIKKAGYNPEISPELLDSKNNQTIEKNIESFKNKAPNEVKDLIKVLNNKNKYKKLLGTKFILSTAIPVAIMGFILPKLNFKLTERIKENKKNSNIKENSSISFKGLYNMSTVNKMAVTDGGLTVGRVSTARNKYEKLEMGFKMSMMMFLNFVAPIWIAKILDKISDVNLDPKILNNTKLLANLKDLPKNNYIEYIDKNPTSDFTKLCKDFCNVKILKSGIRDPRYFVDENKIDKLRLELEKFLTKARKEGNIEKFAKKTLRIKTANILTNVGISSFLLAIALPKLTFFLRKKITGSDAEPGLVN